MKRLLVTALVLLSSAAPAQADIFLSPFAGLKFKGSTNELDLGNGAEDAKLSIGAAAVVIADRGVGFEAELGYNPRFFEAGAGDLVTSSGVTTLFGNVMLALPISITRESLRPYAVGGLGWVHAAANDQIGFNAVSNDFLGLALGLGAIGFVSDTTGLRFDLRYIKSISSADVSDLNQESARISFWRATIGLVFR
ncbi:MAG: outer membrane beta-barrel protein [Vicinamibacterales bacterium]